MFVLNAFNSTNPELRNLCRDTGYQSKTFSFHVEEGSPDIHFRWRNENAGFARLRWFKCDDWEENRTVVTRANGSYAGVLPTREHGPGAYQLEVSIDTGHATFSVTDELDTKLFLSHQDLSHTSQEDLDQLDADKPVEDTDLLFIKVQTTFEEQPPLRGVVAVDIGNTNCSIAYYDADEVDPGAYPMPRSVSLSSIEERTDGEMFSVRSDAFILRPDNLGQDTGAIAIGEQAQEMALDRKLDPFSTRYIPAAKPALGFDVVHSLRYKNDEGKGTEREIGNELVVAGVLNKLIVHARREIKKKGTDVVLTYPPQWTMQQRAGLRDAFELVKKQLGNIELSMNIDEASAAGLYYVYSRIRAESDFDAFLSTQRVKGAVEPTWSFNTLAFDYGGGTLDLSAIRYTLERRKAGGEAGGEELRDLRINVELVDSASLLSHGGDFTTLQLFNLLKRRIAYAITLKDNLNKLDDNVSEDAKRYRTRVQQSNLQATLIAKVKNSVGGEQEHFMEEVLAQTAVLEPSRILELADGSGAENGAVFPKALTSDVADCVEKLVPTRWAKYSGNLEFQARENFHRLWRVAEELKKNIIDDFNQKIEMKGGDFTEAFEKAYDEGVVRPFKAGDVFPWLEGLLNSDKKRDDRQETTYLSIADIFSASAQHIIRGFKRSEEMKEELRRKTEDPNAPYDWIILAGNSCRNPLVRYLFRKKTVVSGENIVFPGDHAKLSVAMGACVKRVIERHIAGVRSELHSFTPKLPRNYLYHYGDYRDLFPVGPINPLAMKEVAVDDWGADRILITEAQEDGGDPSFAGLIPYDQVAGRIDGRNLDEFDPADTIAGCQSVLKALGFDDIESLPTARELERHRMEKNLRKLLPGSQEHTYGDLFHTMVSNYRFEHFIRWVERDHASRQDKNVVLRFYLSPERDVYVVDHQRGGNKLWAKTTDDKVQRRAMAHRLKDDAYVFSGMH